MKPLKNARNSLSLSLYRARNSRAGVNPRPLTTPNLFSLSIEWNSSLFILTQVLYTFLSVNYIPSKNVKNLSTSLYLRKNQNNIYHYWLHVCDIWNHRRRCMKISRDLPFHLLFLSNIGHADHGLPRSNQKLFTLETAGHLAAQRSSYNVTPGGHFSCQLRRVQS